MVKSAMKVEKDSNSPSLVAVVQSLPLYHVVVPLLFIQFSQENW